VDLPLFPLHTVLCPGVSMPLHIFEERYRALVRRCLEESSPFGIVLIHEGREVGRSDLALAGVGTMATIREAKRYPDGRFDILVVGGRRFELESVDTGRAPYLVGSIRELGEELGHPERASALAELAGQRFIRYVELVGALDPGPDEPGAELSTASIHGSGDRGASAEGLDDGPGSDVSDGRSSEDLEDRLLIPDDPLVLGHLLAGILGIEPAQRQRLLETPTAEERLDRIVELLEREIMMLASGLEPYQPDLYPDGDDRN
jgi:Lon protease-like protein